MKCIFNLTNHRSTTEFISNLKEVLTDIKTASAIISNLKMYIQHYKLYLTFEIVKNPQELLNNS